MPKISVILPIYNSEKYLEDCLVSIIGQSFSDIEIICINDGSTDNTYQIIDKYANSDSRFIVVNQENKGAAVARNIGLELAKGEYVIILDSDDYFDKYMLEEFYNLAQKTKSDIVVSNSFSEDGITGEKKIPKHHLKKQLLSENIFNYKQYYKYIFNFSVGWAWDKFYKLDFIKKNDLKFQDLKSTNDVFFVFKSLICANNIAILDKPLITHRINLCTQISSNRDKSPMCFIDAIIAIKQELERQNIYDIVKQSFINWVMEHTVWQARTLKNKEVNSKILNEIYPMFNMLERGEEYFYDGIAYRRMLQLFGWENTKHIPKVSIIIPIYNVENYLRECLKTVTSQTLNDIEIICVNDGSTDNSFEILKEYASIDKRIKVINQKNSGMGAAYNVGIKNSCGTYIGFVEPDDYISPDMFKCLYDTAIRNDVDFVKSDFFSFDTENGFNLIYKKLNTDGKFYNKPVNMQESITPFRFIMNIWTGLYKREYINKNEIQFNETPGASYQDNGFWFQTFCLSNRCYFIDIPLYYHRCDNPNASVKSKEKVFCMKEEYDFIREFLEKRPELKKKFLGIFHYKKYHNYMFTLNRIDKKYKTLFLETFRNEFKEAFEKCEIDENIFRQDELENLKKIINEE